MTGQETAPPDLSLVLVGWQMEREIPRTLWSLSRAFQHGADDIAYEIILVDNGSDRLPQIPDMDPMPQVVRAQVASGSPVGAMNQGLAMARGALIGAWIDGARMASANLLRAVQAAAQLHPRPVLAVPNWQLGPSARQAWSVTQGYDKTVEDALLAQAGWPAPDADLFSVATPEMPQITGPMMESNALFLRAQDWAALGGFDPGFDLVGGGMANPDMYQRALQLEGAQQIRIDGAATFHQIHGGTTTDGKARAIAAVKEAAVHYQRLRGAPIRQIREPGWIFDANAQHVVR